MDIRVYHLTIDDKFKTLCGKDTLGNFHTSAGHLGNNPHYRHHVIDNMECFYSVEVEDYYCGFCKICVEEFVRRWYNAYDK